MKSLMERCFHSKPQRVWHHRFDNCEHPLFPSLIMLPASLVIGKNIWCTSVITNDLLIQKDSWCLSGNMQFVIANFILTCMPSRQHFHSRDIKGKINSINALIVTQDAVR